MKRHQLTARIVLAAAITSALAGGLCAQDDVTLPVRVLANVMIVNSLAPGTAQIAVGGDGSGGTPMGAPGATGTTVPGPLGPYPPTVINPSATRFAPKTTAALLAISIDRWSTEEETAALVQSLKTGGPYALVSVMDRTTVGYIQVSDKLRLPIRVASTWKTDKGQVVRLATSRPILDDAAGQSSRDTDNSIGIVELTLPATGTGEGTLVHAIRVAFDDEGRIVARTLALNTGTQRLTSVERVTEGIRSHEPVTGTP